MYRRDVFLDLHCRLRVRSRTPVDLTSVSQFLPLRSSRFRWVDPPDDRPGNVSSVEETGSLGRPDWSRTRTDPTPVFSTSGPRDSAVTPRTWAGGRDPRDVRKLPLSLPPSLSPTVPEGLGMTDGPLPSGVTPPSDPYTLVGSGPDGHRSDNRPTDHWGPHPRLRSDPSA